MTEPRAGDSLTPQIGSTGTILASAARTTAQTPAAIDNPGFGHLAVVVDVTAWVTGGALTAIVEGLDEASGKWIPILTSAALAAVGTTRLRVGPGITVAANVAAADVMPQTFRIRTTVAGAQSLTYSIGYELV